MKRLNLIIIVLLASSLYLAGCADSKEFESVKITPKYNANEAEPVCCPYDSTSDCPTGYTNEVGYRQFVATGYYSDDSNIDLTDEVKWTTDASGDNVLSPETGGLAYCDRTSGVFSIAAEYSLSTSGSSGTSTEPSTFKDSIMVIVKNQ